MRLIDRLHGIPHRARFACKSSFPAAFAALALIGCAVGCGRSNSTPSAGAPALVPSGGSVQVALVMSGPISDNGWNASAYKGLEAVRKEMNLSASQTAYIEKAGSDGERDKNLRAFASKGYNLIFGHGHEYQDLALRMESDFPKTLFVVSSGDKVGRNTTPIVLQLEDGAYLEGMLAAGMSKTGILAAVGAEKIPPLLHVFSAFEAGAKAVNPNIKMIPPVFTNDWDDPNKALQATLPLIQQGADVIMQDVDAAAQGVFNAVKQSNTGGKVVYALGTNKDQNPAAPEVILASAPILIEKAFVAITKEFQTKGYTPNATPYDMKSGVIGFVLNPNLEAKIPADLKQKIEATRKRILDGSFTVPKGAP